MDETRTRLSNVSVNNGSVAGEYIVSLARTMVLVGKVRSGVRFVIRSANAGLHAPEMHLIWILRLSRSSNRRLQRLGSTSRSPFTPEGSKDWWAHHVRSKFGIVDNLSTEGL